MHHRKDIITTRMDTPNRQKTSQNESMHRDAPRKKFGAQNGSNYEKNIAGFGLNSKVEKGTNIAWHRTLVDKHIHNWMEFRMKPTKNALDLTKEKEEAEKVIENQREAVVHIRNEYIDGEYIQTWKIRNSTSNK